MLLICILSEYILLLAADTCSGPTLLISQPFHIDKERFG